MVDSRLEADSTFVTDLKLCQVRLNHNAAVPWILLIPKQPVVFELIDLSFINQQLLMEEIFHAGQIMRHLFNPTKLNIASLGNIVPQLHIHIIARYTNDKAWPNPIWNSGVTDVYEPASLKARVNQLKETFLRTDLPLSQDGA